MIFKAKHFHHTERPFNFKRTPQNEFRHTDHGPILIVQSVLWSLLEFYLCAS